MPSRLMPDPPASVDILHNFSPTLADLNKKCVVTHGLAFKQTLE